DKEGRSNFSAIKLPETKEEEPSQLTSAVMIFDNGQIYYDDQRIDLGGQLGQFTVGVRPGDGGSSQITVQAQKSDLKYEGRAFNLEQFTLRTKLFKDRAEVESLTFDTGFGKGTLSGEVSDWRKLNY